MRLPASYANFYIGERVVIVPTFNDPKDASPWARSPNSPRPRGGRHSLRDLVWDRHTALHDAAGTRLTWVSFKRVSLILSA